MSSFKICFVYFSCVFIFFNKVNKGSVAMSLDAFRQCGLGSNPRGDAIMLV